MSAATLPAPTEQPVQLKRCSGPIHSEPVMLPVNSFNRSKRYRIGLQPWCKACYKQYRKDKADKYLEYARTWRETNPEKNRESTKRWFKNNPERAKGYHANYLARLAAAPGNFMGTPQEQALALHLNKYCCQRCMSRDTLTFDHITPITWGGPDTLFNIQVLCKYCNSSKLNRHDQDYRRYSIIPLELATE